MSYIAQKTVRKIKQHLKEKFNLTKRGMKCYFNFLNLVLFCSNNRITYAKIKKIKQMYKDDKTIKIMLDNLALAGWLSINKQYLINSKDGKPRVSQFYRIRIRHILDDLLFNNIINSNDFMNIKGKNYNLIKHQQSIIGLLGYKDNTPIEKKKYSLLTIRDTRGGKCICGCDCGGERRVDLKDLESGKIKTCGCADREFNEICDKLENLHDIIRAENNGVVTFEMFKPRFLQLRKDKMEIIEFCDG